MNAPAQFMTPVRATTHLPIAVTVVSLLSAATLVLQAPTDDSAGPPTRCVSAGPNPDRFETSATAIPARAARLSCTAPDGIQRVAARSPNH